MTSVAAQQFGPISGPDLDIDVTNIDTADTPVFDTTVLDPSSLDTAQLLDWLSTAAWVSAALSGVGVLYGLVLLAFGSRRAPGVIIGGIVGAVIAVAAASTVIPQLYHSASLTGSIR